MSGFGNVSEHSISEVSSLKTINNHSTNSYISSMNDGLLSQEMSIFEAIAQAVIGIFAPETHKRTVNALSHPTPTESEFAKIKDNVNYLNDIIQEYKNLMSQPQTQDVEIINIIVDKIDKMINKRAELIISFGKFISMAENSPQLQYSILKNKVGNINVLADSLADKFIGIDKQLLKKELRKEELQSTLAKFIRAMGLLDNMKHRLNLKKMIAQRTTKLNTLNKSEQPSLITQLLSVAIVIDAAIKQFVDEPALSVFIQQELNETEALGALNNIRDEAKNTVSRLTDNSSSGDGSTQNKPQSRSSEGDFSQLEGESPLENMEPTFDDLKGLLTNLKTRIWDLSHTEPNVEENAEANDEANKIIDEIQSQNATIQLADTTGGKLHKQKRRVKWSTPRRHRNSRVKSMKPKKIQNRRKTKSAHKKRATKKH